ncbi:MAG: hypothetical protein U9O85_04235 [Euryarchaeota archaeon]|nr:hypothetical protein [Euryarchaeota archaeon]
MMTLKALLDFLNPLQTNTALYKSLTDLVTAKLEAPQLSIRATKKWGLPDLSTSFHYDKLKELGELLINGVISLEDFLLYSASNTKVSDAAFISDFRIINHNKRHLTKPKELINAIETGKLKKGIGSSSMAV